MDNSSIVARTAAMIARRKAMDSVRLVMDMTDTERVLCSTMDFHASTRRYRKRGTFASEFPR